MVGKRDEVLGGGNCQVDCASKFNIGQHSRLAGIFWIKDDERLSARSITDRDEALTIIEPLQETIAYTIRLTVLNDCPFPIAHRERFAARGERDSIALWMECI